jgi:maltose alpha-D-glucosyltransferase/alpha-amylase
VLYYGDEIGMGDNIWLGDRDGVRTPMQWTPDRNAGFSTCDPGRLYLPAIMDPVFGYQATNVEAADPELLLAAALDQADDRGPQAEPGVRPGTYTDRPTPPCTRSSGSCAARTRPRTTWCCV